MAYNPPTVDRFSYEKTISQVGGIIRTMGMPAVLRRGIVPNISDRPCRIFVRKYTVREMMGGLVDPMERFVLMSADGLKIPPEHSIDSIITFFQPMTEPPIEDENLRIIEPAVPIKPAGILVAWKVRVRR
jgi:hypothetical protein